jgi:hypothetical protein
MKQRREENINAFCYEQETPDMWGNLHQRMKFVVQLLGETRSWHTCRAAKTAPEFNQLFHDLAQGILNLQTEVKHYRPAEPPFARRTSRVGVTQRPN